MRIVTEDVGVKNQVKDKGKDKGDKANGKDINGCRYDVWSL